MFIKKICMLLIGFLLFLICFICFFVVLCFNKNKCFQSWSQAPIETVAILLLICMKSWGSWETFVTRPSKIYFLDSNRERSKNREAQRD